ncbi:MAG: DUF1947 domain-containing protein [Candidatus Odinarchaeia archaeon]
MKIKSRHFLSSKDLKHLIKELLDTTHLNSLAPLMKKRGGVEVIKLDTGEELYSVNGEIMLIRREKKLIPPLTTLISGTVNIPKIVVDMGAVPHIARGADVMAPGVVRVDQSISQGDIITVVDEKHGKPLAIGEALLDGAEIVSKKHGKVVRVIHFVGDSLWDFVKNFKKD